MIGLQLDRVTFLANKKDDVDLGLELRLEMRGVDRPFFDYRSDSGRVAIRRARLTA